MMSNRILVNAQVPQSLRAVAVALSVAMLNGCASVDRPILYPNERYQAVGKPAAEQAVNTCMGLAQGAGADTQESDVVRRTATASVVGGATGAVIGSFSGSAGRGLAAGAAAGAAGGLISSALTPSQPSAGYRAFVQRCLADRGFEVVGWR
jgi:outer membrane lipoprotein SlyB